MVNYVVTQLDSDISGETALLGVSGDIIVLDDHDTTINMTISRGDINKMFFIATASGEDFSNLNLASNDFRVASNTSAEGGFTPNIAEANTDTSLNDIASDAIDALIIKAVAKLIDDTDIALGGLGDVNINKRAAYRRAFQISRNEQEFMSSLKDLFHNGTASTNSTLGDAIAAKLKANSGGSNLTSASLQSELITLLTDDSDGFATDASLAGVGVSGLSVSAIPDASASIQLSLMRQAQQFGGGTLASLIDVDGLFGEGGTHGETAAAGVRGAFSTNNVTCIPLTFSNDDTISFLTTIFTPVNVDGTEVSTIGVRVRIKVTVKAAAENDTNW